MAIPIIGDIIINAKNNNILAIKLIIFIVICICYKNTKKLFYFKKYLYNIVLNMVKMRKKCKILSFKKKKHCVTKPYVIYKLNGNLEKNFLISKYASLTDNDEMMGKIIKLIKENGNRIYGTKFSINTRTGKLIYRSKDGLYGLWKSNLNKCIYLLLYVDYGEIKGSLKKWVTN